jgi:serine beta-lactamase-like protein LACTB, mitochondrial
VKDRAASARALAAMGPWLLASLLVAAPASAGPVPARSGPRPAASPAAPVGTPLPAWKVGAMEAAINGQMARLGIPGMTVAVVTGDQVRWTAGFGLADVENAVPARQETAYRIASLSKPITATAVLQLAEKRHLDLDAPVQRYVPSFPEKAWPVTPRLLLGHLGGIRHLRPEEFGSTRHYESVIDALEAFKDDPLEVEPGTRTLYSTYGFNLLGAVTEAAAGLPFLEYLQQAIFEPAGMSHTTPDNPYAIIPNRAQGYVRLASGELQNSALADTTNKIPGGGLSSTAADVAAFAAALNAGALLQPATRDRMFTRQRTRDGKRTDYGLGWRVDERRGVREVWQHGGQPRVSTFLYLQPDRHVAVVFLCNLEGVATAFPDLAREIADVAAR